MKNIFVIVLIITMLSISGCTYDKQEENPQTELPEINLDPILLPVEEQAGITQEKEGFLFQWPGQEWILMEDETGLYALAQDLSYRLDLQPKSQQIQSTPLSWHDKEAFQEAFVIQEVVTVKKGLLLVTEDDHGLYGLAHLQKIMDGQLEWLIIESKEMPQYIISQDKSKVVYGKLPESHLSAYHTETGRITPFPGLTDDQFCGDWVQQINVSPLGGYLTYLKVECTRGNPIQFIIIGADTGRLIRDDLPGIDPRWDFADQQIIFQLLDDETTSSDESEKVKKQQLGMYSLETKDIVFFNQIANEFSLYRSPLFSEESAYFIYPIKNDQESRLIIYHTVQQLQQAILLPESTMVIETDQWGFMNDRILVVTARSKGDHQLIIHHISSELTEIIGPIDYWINGDKSLHWFEKSWDGGVYYMKDGTVMQAKDGSHRSVLKIQNNTQLAGIDRWGDWLLITVVTSQGEKQLYFVDL